MHTLFGGEQAVDVLAFYGESDALESRFAAFLSLVDLHFEAAALEPAQVHAQQHLGPVLRLGAASPGVDGENGAALVVLAAEEALLLPMLKLALQRPQAVGQFGEELAVHGVAGELLAHELLSGRELLEPLLQAAVLARDARRRLLVVPERGRAHTLLEGGDLGSQLRGVKDSSAASSDAHWRP